MPVLVWISTHHLHRLNSNSLYNATQVATDEEGRSRGFGFVHFDSESAAQGCINDANGRIINGKEVRRRARNLSFLCSGCRLVGAAHEQLVESFLLGCISAGT